MVAGGASCGGDAQVSHGLDLVPLDTVLIAETDSAYIGRPAGLYVDRVGRIYISDLLGDRVLQFDSTGRMLRSFGRPGAGPGEFRGVGEVLLEWNGTIAVQSYGQRRITFFDVESGEVRATVRYAGTLTSGTVADSVGWFGNIDPKAGFGVMRIDLRHVGREAGAPLLSSSVSPLPVMYRQNEAIRGTYGMVQVAAFSDTLLVGYAAESLLVVHLGHGAPLDTLIIPSRIRRGIPPDFVQRMDLRRSTIGEMIGMASALFGIWVVPQGFLLAYLDSSLEGKRNIHSRAFLSLLTSDRSRVCVDSPLRLVGEAQPRFAVQGDRIAVLDQYVTAGSRVKTVVRWYRLDPRRCTWYSTHRTAPGV